MSRNKFLVIPVSVIVFAILACSLAGVPVAVSEPSQEPAVPVGTQVAEALTLTLAADTALPNTAAVTQAALPTATPEFTFTPSLTPTATFTFTPAVPMVSVSIATNCRSGPNTAYDILGVLKVGEKAEVVGRSTLAYTMIIRLPSNTSITCWLWAQNATVVGDTSRLPLISIPPSPTPKASPTPTATPTPWASFKVEYASRLHCDANYYLKFKITNNGTLTWQSNKVSVTDQVTHQVRAVTYSFFPNYISCTQYQQADNLEAGEVAMTQSDNLAANPAGHSILATIRLCSGHGLTGTCLEKTFTFTP